MKIRYCSDLHLEFDKHIWTVPVQPDDHATVLVLAGDIWNGTRPVSYSGGSWLGELSKRFYHVVLVLGNHDYYRENVDRLPTKFRAVIAEQGLSNVHLLEISDGIEMGKVMIDGVAFVGGTLWTSMGNGNPTVSTDFDILKSGNRYTWNDRNHIRSGTQYHRFSSSDWLRIHRKSINNLRSFLEETCSPTVLVSHHAPFMASTYGDDDSDYLYASDLQGLLFYTGNVVACIHGHTHRTLSYDAGGIHVLCNPRGYSPYDLNKEFDENAFIIVE